MKNFDPTTDEEVMPEERRLTRRAPARRMPPPTDELPPSLRRSAAVLDLKTRLDRFCRRGRFDQAVDLKLLAATWATDYVSQVFPQVEDDQRIRLLLAAEAGFQASIELSKNGIRHWERLLEEARNGRDEFRLK